ncbi:Cytochrome c oxidase subunit 6B [Smittium culicis]|uniref:Cytochrome c oxidase subunit 12, mitochondrial n=1 Tax=Smittium culicis TaxID=133412 RepID=A0A1R1YL35_9FUNG|nr:Cytochrome c oxidase subunit 6B [Smittium culicis]
MAITEIKTPGYDGRFPHTNASRRCYQNYIDYHRCILVKSEDNKTCKELFREFNSLCPIEWTEKWDAQREEGVFPFKFE